ncbi:MAG: ABC transporter substrate-binding protein, partial [Desulfobacterales bacterium]
MVGAQSTVLEPVTIQLRWFHQFQFAGYYAAIEKGFYAEEGLRVSLREFEPGKDRIAPVLEGKAQYGVGDPSLLKLRMQGQPLVVLAQIFQHSPSVLMTRRESGVFSPEELVGKKVMMPLGDFGSAAIQVMILDALGDLNRLSLIPQTYNHEKLITGDIDAMATYLSNEPFKLKSKGVAVNVIDPRSYGIDFYGDNLFTTEKEVDQQPDRVKKMVRATLKGWEYALEHKDEIIDLILKKYNPALGRNQLGYEAKVVDQMIVPDLVPIGEINPRRYERIAETYRRLGISQSSTVPEGFIYRAKPEPAVLLTAEERAWLAAHPDILIGYTDVFEPEVIANPDGSHRGILVDFLDELNRRLGTRIRLRIDPIPELLGKAQKRATDGILNILPEYADKLGLLKTDGYMTGYGAVFTRKNIVFDRPSDLAGKKVAIIDGVMFTKLIVERYGDGATILKVNDALEGLQLVDRGEVDLFLGASINAYFLSKYQLFGLVLQYVYYSHPYTGGMAIRPDWPELVTILNKGIASFSKNEINAIVAKWVNVPGQKQTLELTAEEQAWLDQNHTVRVRAADWPPYLIVKENEPPQGIAIEYLKLIEERTGLTFEYEMAKQSFAEFLESMKQRQGPDMTSLIVQTPGREQYLSFTTPYISSPYVIFAREQKETLLDISGLSGKALAVPKGFIIQQFLEMDYPEI